MQQTLYTLYVIKFDKILLDYAHPFGGMNGCKRKVERGRENTKLYLHHTEGYYPVKME